VDASLLLYKNRMVKTCYTTTFPCGSLFSFQIKQAIINQEMISFMLKGFDL
jgi:hypothetical protein